MKASNKTDSIASASSAESDENVDAPNTLDDQNDVELGGRVDTPDVSSIQNDVDVELGQKWTPSRSPMTEKYTYREHLFIVVVAMILSFNSGLSNGISLSGMLTPPEVTWDQQSTSGFTGVYTASALALADKSQEIEGFAHEVFFRFQVFMILSFIAGSCISALLNPRPTPWRLAPMYAPTFLIGSIFMCIAAVISVTEQDGRDHFFYFVAAANGIQNGISSMYSSNLIRTTHLTGTTTDIGLFIGQRLRGNKTNVWKLRILIGLALSFWMGGFLAFFAVKRFTKYTLMFNAAIFLLVFFVVVGFLAVNLHLPIHKALRGAWHWQRALHGLDFRCNSSGAPKSKEDLKDVFDSMDEDGDGEINAEDLFKGLQKAGLDGDFPLENVQLMFEVADRNCDGKICLEEFCSLVHGDHVIVG
ncbi:MAG: hypothetical protein SGARI_003763 [Bacillariaceae sp.]